MKKIENLEQTETNQSSITNVNIIPQNHEIHQESIRKNEITTNPKLNEIEKIIGEEENSIQKKEEESLVDNVTSTEVHVTIPFQRGRKKENPTPMPTRSEGTIFSLIASGLISLGERKKNLPLKFME